MRSPLHFIGVRAVHYLIFCVVFVNFCSSFCLLSVFVCAMALSVYLRNFETSLKYFPPLFLKIRAIFIFSNTIFQNKLYLQNLLFFQNLNSKKDTKSSQTFNVINKEWFHISTKLKWYVIT